MRCLSILAVAIATTAHAVTPDTQWWYINPTNTIAQVAEGAGLATKTFVTNEVAHAAAASITNGWRYAMFILPMSRQNDHQWWTQFEMKASTNNFAGGDIVMHAMSSYADLVAANGNAITSQYQSDAVRIYLQNLPSSVFDVSGLDDRAYHRIASTVEIPGSWCVNEYIVIVDPAMLHYAPPAADGSTWCDRENSNLVWIYFRASDYETEKDEDMRIKYHPISPVCWFKELPQWASQAPLQPIQDGSY